MSCMYVFFQDDLEISQINIPDEGDSVDGDNELSIDEIFKLYNNRFIIDKNGVEMLVRNEKFWFPENVNSTKILKSKKPTYKKVVRINQNIWNTSNMFTYRGFYDGGRFTGNEND